MLLGPGIALVRGMMTSKLLNLAGVILAVNVLDVGISAASPTAQTESPARTAKTQKKGPAGPGRPSRKKKLAKEGGWAGAGLAAGQAAGPAGSAVVGAAKYRKDLKAGGSRRTKAVAKIGAPIAAGAVAGPAGTVGVEGVEHRKWIKHEVGRIKPHKSHAAPEAPSGSHTTR